MFLKLFKTKYVLFMTQNGDKLKSRKIFLYTNNYIQIKIQVLMIAFLHPSNLIPYSANPNQIKKTKIIKENK